MRTYIIHCKSILLSLFFLLNLALTCLQAQEHGKPGIITGRVVLDDGSPAVGANVLVGDTRFGAVTDDQGMFTVNSLPPGKYTLSARLLGYEQLGPTELTVISGKQTTVELRLRLSAIELTPVDVTAIRRQKVDDTRTSLTTITPRETKRLPGGAEDVLRSLQALPGVLSAADYSAQIVVRGSGPDQNLIMIDGFEVLNPYRLYGVVSMFNPETVSAVSLQTGGFSVQYGDRLSSVLDVRNRQGRTEHGISGKFNTSITNANVILEGGLPFGSFLLSTRRTYYDLILGPILRSSKIIEGDVALPNFHDVQALMTIPVGSRNTLSFHALTSRDGVNLISGPERERPDSVNIFDTSHNTLLGLSWRYAPSPRFFAQTQVSWYQNSGTGEFDGTFVDPSQNTGEIERADTMGLRLVRFAVNYDYSYRKWTLTQRLFSIRGAHTLEYGFGIDNLGTDRTRFFEIDRTLLESLKERGVIVPTNSTAGIEYNRYNIYLQDNIALNSRFYLQPGLRMDYYPMLGRRAYIAPRINASYGIDNLSKIRAAYGVFYQSPGMDKQNFPGRLDFTREYFSTLIAERADHYILGFSRMVSAEWESKIEGYYKSFSDVIVAQKLAGSINIAERTDGDIFSREGWTNPTRVPQDSLVSIPVNDATGRAWGIEIMLQKIQSGRNDRFNGWVSYALSFADRIRDGITTPFIFDQRHAVNIVGEYRFNGSWDIAVNFTLRSGRPYLRALGVKPRILNELIEGRETPMIQTDEDGKVILDIDYEKDTFSGRLDLYHTLNVRATTYPQWWGLQWSIYLDVTNIYNHANQQQVNYYVTDKGTLGERVINGIPIFPALGVTIEF